MPRRIVFWEPSASPHKFQFFEALAAICPGVEILCIADADLSPERKRLGWSYEAPHNFALYIDLPLSEINKFIDTGKETLHVFSGIRHHRNISEGIRLCLERSAWFTIMSEPRVSEGAKGWLRKLQSFFTERAIRANTKAVFAIGAHGPRWFTSVGYNSERIFPFAYFVSPPNSLASDFGRENMPEAPGTVFGYIGRLNSEKGFDDVLTVFSEQMAAHELLVAGTGPLSDKVSSLISGKSITGEYLGALPIQSVSAFYKKVDVILVPSKTTDDGWGVVVSEALMSGVRVIVSPLVGASLCVNYPGAGIVMDSANSRSLASACHAILSNNMRGGGLSRQELHRKSVERLSADAGAKYFKQLIDHIYGKVPIQPIAPWEV